MADRGKRWVYRPPKERTSPMAAANKPSATIKAQVETKAQEFVASVLKPRHVQPPPENTRLNYIVDIATKWYGRSFYFYATYHSPGPSALMPSFEARFARLEYRGPDRFSLAFMRHTGQWVELYPELSLDQCFEAIRDESFFIP